MLRGATALLLSCAVHAAILVCVYLLFMERPTPFRLPELDVSSVEMSFSEQPVETAPPRSVPQMPSSGHLSQPLQKIPDVPAAEPVKIQDGTPSVSFKPAVPLAPKTLPLKVPEADVPVRAVSQPTAASPVPAPDPTPAPVQAQAQVRAQPQILNVIRPVYPDRARRRGYEGDVTLDITVSAAGDVSEVAVAHSSGHAELDTAAMRAVRQARFRAALAGGTPVSAHAKVTLSFRLKDLHTR